MEAAPRLPMMSFDLNVCMENVSFGPKLKQYITNFYHEDGESYNTEIHNLETLRGGAVRATTDVAGCQLLKKYYCQLHFLKSRFPMEEGQPAAVHFSWKNSYSSVTCKAAEINLELMAVLYNIGALHSKLGAEDGRSTHDGMKMACTHFQCAAWAFQTVKETYPQMINTIMAVEIVHFMQQVCLAQAQECILEKSMMDNRKATIIAKVAVQVVDYYKSALHSLQVGGEEGPFSDIIGSRTSKEWTKYLNFKIAYHKCIALLFQGQQAEEQQKMGERVCFYQAACEQMEEARKLAKQPELTEGLAFVSDVVEGKRKAAKNENEFIYHEEVPDKDVLQEVKGASLVKGIPFSVNDPEVSGKDIFSRLVPMEAHEAASLYSEKKAQLLRQIADMIEEKDNKLVEFMSSMQLDVLTQMRQASGLTAELVDRAAALCAKPTATKELIDAMANLSNSFHEVDSMLKEIQELLDEEDKNESKYQTQMGTRPPSIIATDLSREAAKYKEAHTKASESNQTLHRAMTTHIANLKVLGQPLSQLQQQIPAVVLPNKNVDEDALRELENLLAKVEEMKNQRAMFWAQLRESLHTDDITGVLITRQSQPLEDVFHKELEKHQSLINLIEQNTSAQENILSALVTAYANFTTSRRYLQDVINKRNTTINALITSYDTYDDLLGKANKGIQFYNKLETNVSKLLQRIKSAKKVQEEEREQLLSKNLPPMPVETVSATPKLKDYLDSMKKESVSVGTNNLQQFSSAYPANVNVPVDKIWPPGVRPAPLGSEMNADPPLPTNNEQMRYANYGPASQFNPAATVLTQSYSNANMSYVQNQASDPSYAYGQRANVGYGYVDQQQQQQQAVVSVPSATYSYGQAGEHTNLDQNLADRMASLMGKRQESVTPTAEYPPNQYAQYGYNPQTTPTYSSTNYSYPAITQSYTVVPSNQPVASPPPQNYPPTSQIDYSMQPPINYMQYPATGVDNSYGYASGSYSSYTPQSFCPTVPISGVNCVSYSTNGFNNQAEPPQNNYGNYAYANDAYANVYGGAETQYTYNYGVQNDGANAYYPYYNVSYENTGTTTVNAAYVQPPPVVATQAGGSTTVGTQQPTSSNVDLLAGLDFTISQAPLTPQQPTKVEEPTQTPMTTKSKSEVSVPPMSATKSVTKLEEKPAVKKPEVKVLEVPRRNLLENSDTFKVFAQEVEKYEKFVDVLTKKTLNGPTTLEVKWKEIQDKQDVDVQTKSISVARCYPMKNRFPDILPYDQSRVELASAKDDYINASYVKDVTPYTPFFIVTQAPTASTIPDFWVMVREQQVEIIVCLVCDNEISDEIYWPKERGDELTISNMLISLQSVVVKPHWTERLITIALPEQRESRIVVHVQFTSWPGSLFPTTSQPFVGFVKEVVNLQQQQRVITHPVVVHCLSGVGRSGLFCLLTAAVLDLSVNPMSVPDLTALAVKLSSSRKNVLRDREHLKFAYQAFLQYLKDLLMNHGAKRGENVVVKQECVGEIEDKKDDPLSSLDPFWASKKGGN